MPPTAVSSPHSRKYSLAFITIVLTTHRSSIVKMMVAYLRRVRASHSTFSVSLIRARGSHHYRFPIPDMAIVTNRSVFVLFVVLLMARMPVAEQSTAHFCGPILIESLAIVCKGRGIQDMMPTYKRSETMSTIKAGGKL